MIEIDGSFGEGGGQILRTALSLSSCIGVPFRIENIRKSRKRSGLLPQHLAAVRAMASICGAHVEGAAIGSSEILFEPGRATPGTYRFDIGTAGAVTLLLQALLPPLVFAGAPSRVVLSGGTHVPTSPSFNYLQDIFMPALATIGVTAEASLENFGFYPRGGGRILAQISPQQMHEPLQSVLLNDPHHVTMIRGISGVANLPLSIAERQKTAASRVLGSVGLPISIDVVAVQAFSPGTFIFLRPEGDNCLAGFSALGKRGKRAEQVGEEAANALLNHVSTRECLDPNVADQIALYLAMARGRSEFTTSSITQHLLTNLAVIQRFVGMSYSVEGDLNKPGKVVIIGVGISP